MPKNLKQLENEIFKCRKCSRLCQINPFPMPHIYYGDPKEVELFCIGRNPGIEDSYDGIPLDSFMKLYHERWWECRVGKYLRSKLGDNIILHKFFFTNICKCSSPKNANLFPDEKENCYPYLIEQIELIKPLMIVTISDDAYKMLHPKIKLGYFGKIAVVPLYHPSYFAYSKDKKAIEKQDDILKSIKEIFK